MICDSSECPAQYGPNALCVVGLTRASASTPIAVQYDKLLVVLILDRTTGIILDAECNMVLDVTSDFISSLFIGRCFFTELDQMVADVLRYYQGISQRALTVCLKDAYSKLLDRSPYPIPFSAKKGLPEKEPSDLCR